MAHHQPPVHANDSQRWQSSDPLMSSTQHDSPPPPPAHRLPVGLHAQSNYAHMQQPQRPHLDPNNYSDYSSPDLTPSSSSLNENVAGHTHNRSQQQYASGATGRPLGVPDAQPHNSPFGDPYGQPRAMYSQRSLGSGGGPFASGAAGMYSSNSSIHSMQTTAPQGLPYSDSPYNRYSSSNLNLATGMAHINPHELADDDDWGTGPEASQSKRRSFVPFGGSRDGSRHGSPGSSILGGVSGTGAAAGAGAAAGTLGVASAEARDGTARYNALPASQGNNGSSPALLQEKSNWAQKDDLRKRKKRMWIAIAVIALIVGGAILGGVLGALLNKSNSANSSTGSVSADDVAQDNKDDLGASSAEIKKLMNNPNLHKVFPGMDYTPLNAQYPDCLKVGPSQNNITRDMAVMSQLTNTVRTYGTDCNQTQMLIHAIDRLNIKSSMKLWLGVWLDNNATTTQRQIDQTWKILDDYGCDYFKGVIIGNEVLYAKYMTADQLITHVQEFKKNITDHKCSLPVAIADLGDNWTASMASQVDVVMSNVHPFFAGVNVKDAAGWTWSFWQNNDVTLTANNKNIKQVIAEVGWPSGGGKSCGQSPTCDSSTPGSVAGVTELNQFMQDWICPSLKNGTEYFWFSAFDEPWKTRYNTPGKEWEDKWGLMDINRNVKSGVKIPDCGGAALPSS